MELSKNYHKFFFQNLRIPAFDITTAYQEVIPPNSPHIVIDGIDITPGDGSIYDRSQDVPNTNCLKILPAKYEYIFPYDVELLEVRIKPQFRFLFGLYRAVGLKGHTVDNTEPIPLGSEFVATTSEQSELNLFYRLSLSDRLLTGEAGMVGQTNRRELVVNFKDLDNQGVYVQGGNKLTIEIMALENIGIMSWRQAEAFCYTDNELSWLINYDFENEINAERIMHTALPFGEQMGVNPLNLEAKQKVDILLLGRKL